MPREYDISNLNLAMVRRVGGVVGPFVAEERIEPRKSGPWEPATVANNCWMSSKNFAFSFRFALDSLRPEPHGSLASPVGMATDFTLIPQVAPRFGKNACNGFSPFDHGSAEYRAHHAEYNAKAQQHEQNGVLYKDFLSPPTVKVKKDQTPLAPYRMGQRVFDFNVDGLAHYGMMPDMLQDLKNVGMPRDDFQALFSSAEGYLRMWERAERLADKRSY